MAPPVRAQGASKMSNSLLLAFLLLAIILVWVIAKVIYYARVSENQWQKADKSRLKKWPNDD